MKTISILFTILVLGLTTIQPVSASDTYPESVSVIKLRETFSDVLNNIPFEDLLYKYEESRLTVTFKVNSSHEITDVQVFGDNQNLVRYAQVKLTRRPIKVDPRVEQKGYYISYHYIIK